MDHPEISLSGRELKILGTRTLHDENGPRKGQLLVSSANEEPRWLNFVVPTWVHKMSIILVTLAAVIVAGLPLFCIVDAAKRTPQAFGLIDSNKTLWIVLPLVFPFLGAAAYLIAIRPRFEHVHRRGA